MANRRTYADVINPGNNPNSNFQNQQSNFILDDHRQPSSNNRSAQQIRYQNEKLKMMISQMQKNKPNLQEQIIEQGGIPNEFNKRIQYNTEKIKDLQEKVREQQQVMKAYQEKFAQFQDNLTKIMRLDKDIHSKLVNPQQSSTLEKNVKNVMLALNSGASYEKVLNMIDSIRV